MESVEALKTLAARRKDLRLRFPNLVDYESKVLFRSFYQPRPLPDEHTEIDDVDVRKTMFGGLKRTPVRRPFRRSPGDARERRRKMRIGMIRFWQLFPTRIRIVSAHNLDPAA